MVIIQMNIVLYCFCVLLSVLSAMMTVELSWTVSTLFFFLLVHGIVSYHFGIKVFWYLLALISFGGCITSYFVPNLSIFQASIATVYTRQVDDHGPITNIQDSHNTIVIEQINTMQSESNLRLVGYLKLFTQYPR